MHRHRLTRRQALHAGAAAAVAGALRPRTALAAARPALFELPLHAATTLDASGRRVTPVLRAPRRFDMVGLTWSRGSVHADVRARRRNGAWSPWLPLHPTGAHGPDAGTRVSATDPAYTGAADHLQLRFRGEAEDLRARFVHAQPAARVARAAQVPRTGGATPDRRGARSAVATPPTIIPREAWGAALYPPRTEPQYGQVHAAFVHHTVSANAYGPEESAGIVLGILRFHRNTNGWNDIGYNFLVDQYGQVFEGRAGGVDQAVIGAQAQGYNTWSTGVALIGTHESVPAGDAALEAVARLLGWKLSIHGVPIEGTVTVTSMGGDANRYPSGTAVTLSRVGGHRDGDATSCPGTALYAQLPELRRRAAGYAGPVGAIWMRAWRGTTVRHPKPLEVTGWLRLPGGGLPPNGTVLTIEFEGAVGGWTPIAETAADGNGTWHAEVPLPDTGTIRVVHPASGIVSPLLSVGLIPRMTLAAPPRTVQAGARVRLAGTYAPSVAPRRATILVERRDGRRWRRVTSRAVTVRDGRYATVVRLRTPGRHRVTAIAGDARVQRTLTVAARP